MAKFIRLTQLEPDIGEVTINQEDIIRVERSGHAEGGSTVVMKHGRVFYDPENGGWVSQVASCRVKEGYEAISRRLEAAFV